MPNTHKRIYLDHAASTPTDTEVLAAMQPYWKECYANPSSIHKEGAAARVAIERARLEIAEILQCKAREIVFTSGGTESNNLAIQGIVRAAEQYVASPHLILSSIEHPSVLEAAKLLEHEGTAQVSYIPVNPNGIVVLDAIQKELRPNTVLVSIMYANNEIGTIQPIKEVARIIQQFRKQNKVFSTTYNLQPTTYPYFHTDACQAAPALSLNPEGLGVDVMTLNGAKIYGPKGIGMLYKRSQVPLNPIIVGGSQEHGERAGTEFVAGYVGFARALSLSSSRKELESERLCELRDSFIKKLKERHGDMLTLNGDALVRLPNNVNVSFKNVLAERLVLELDAHGIACSSGSSCQSLKNGLSHVIMAMTGSSERANSALRFSLGRDTSEADLDYVTEILAHIIPRLQGEISL